MAAVSLYINLVLIFFHTLEKWIPRNRENLRYKKTAHLAESVLRSYLKVKGERIILASRQFQSVVRMASKFFIMYTKTSNFLFSGFFLSLMLKSFSCFVNFSVVMSTVAARVICVAWV